METVYQSCLSQFDLDLLDQGTSANQTVSLAGPNLNVKAKKKGVYLLKLYMKQFSERNKLEESNRAIENIDIKSIEKQLLHNEECKDICKERNEYYQKAMEYANDNEKLKAQIILLEEKYSDAMNSVAASEVHSMQFKELTKELEAVQDKIKKIIKERMREKKGREIAENKLRRVLSDFISPNKKNSKWIQNLKKKYGKMKEHDIKNEDSVDDSSADEMFDDVPVPMSPTNSESKLHEDEEMSKFLITTCGTDNSKLKAEDLSTTNVFVNKTVIIDFENVGSVDTGRGSSLAVSDGEKSSLSPDYYMSDSPLSTAPHLCSKCNKSKSDVGTSPIPEEMLDGTETAMIVTHKLSNNIFKSDASTNTMPWEINDVATNTSEVIPVRLNDACTSPVTFFELVTSTKTSDLHANIKSLENETGNEEFSDNFDILDEDSSETVVLSTNDTSNVELYIYENSLEENEIEAVDIKDLANSNSLLVKPAAQESIVPLNKFYSVGEIESKQLNYSQDTNTEPTISVSTIDTENECLQDKGNVFAQEHSPHGSLTTDDWESSTELPTIPVQIVEDIRPNLELNICRPILQEKDPEKNHNNENMVVHDTCMDQSKANNTSDVINDSRMSVSTMEEETVVYIEVTNETETGGINNNITTNDQHNQVQKCLELNNSNNLNNDFSTDNEIQMIINKMKLSHPFITPLPRTPMVSERQKNQSETLLSKDANKAASVQPIEEIDEYLNVIRQKMRDALGLYFPDLIELVVKKISKEKNNQDLLHCLLQQVPDSSQYDNPTHINMQNDDEEIIEASINVPTSVVENCNNELIICPTELKKSNNMIVYENAECASDDDSSQQNWESETTIDKTITRETTVVDDSGVIRRRGLKNTKKSKLQKLKMNMIPKSKIRPAHGKTFKKLKYKPKPIIPKPKRKVTAADTCATLNDKAVYEKAVKIITESKSKNIFTREARVIMRDCASNILNSPNKKVMNDNGPQLSANNIKGVLRKSESDIIHVNKTEEGKRNKSISLHKEPDLNPVNIPMNDKVHEVNKQNSDSGLFKTKRNKICSLETSNSQNNNKNVEDIDAEPVAKKRRIANRSNNCKELSDDGHEPTKIEPTKYNSPIINKRRTSTRLSCNSPCQNVQENNEIAANNDNNLASKVDSNRKSQIVSADNIPSSPQRILRSSSVKQNYATARDVQSKQKDCNKVTVKNASESMKIYKKSILCTAIEKYGVQNNYKPAKINETIIDEKWDKLEKSLESIVQLPNNSCTDEMNQLVADIRSWNYKHFIMAFMKYLKNPQRKLELFNKSVCPPAPPMTKKEQVLIYVIDQLQNNWRRGIVEKILENIEYILFALNRTPETNVIEAMAHFYALICRYYQKQSKLRLFVIDAMYCLSYKSIPLVMQCLEEWMFILPLGHMGLAKTPLVACLVYLLHFYKCEKDARKCVQEMRSVLHRKYYYDFSDWNETKVLEMFRTSIKELRDCDIEKKMLRIALIILAKRNGTKWCQTNIINNMLQPLIENEKTSDTAKQFCISVLGPLVKPYPNDMKSYSEIVAHYLMKKLEQNNSQKMQEAIVSSLLFMNKHNSRINDYLLKWCPKRISPQFDAILRDYVRSKTVKAWKFFLTNNNIK